MKKIYPFTFTFMWKTSLNFESDEKYSFSLIVSSDDVNGMIKEKKDESSIGISHEAASTLSGLFWAIIWLVLSDILPNLINDIGKFFHWEIKNTKEITWIIALLCFLLADFFIFKKRGKFIGVSIIILLILLIILLLSPYFQQFTFLKNKI